jgi:sucrose-6-phosphate hydrolase SacC (GH32 family)
MKRTLLGLRLLTVLLVAMSAGFTSAADPQTEPLKTAMAYWSMSDSADARGRIALQSQGNVALGVALQGAEREASLARGGDGKAARFDGGYLALANDAALSLPAQQWTIAIRMRDPQGTWRYPILGNYGSDTSVSVALRAVDIASKPQSDRNYAGSPAPSVESWFAAPGGPREVPGTSLIEVVWGAREPDPARVKRIRQFQPDTAQPNQLRQDVLSGVMRVNFPVGLIGPTEWHDIVLSMTGPKLALWIDGVLVDEEFPVGETRPRRPPFLIGAGQENGQLKTGFRGWVDHVAIWNRPLSPAEIAAVSGGKEHVRSRELAILGDESPSMQYFRARGHNRKAGDCIPYWDAQTGTFRLFYLILRRNMHSKWDGGHGGLEIWQASTKDLKAWTHHPVTIPITEQWEAWNGTGAVAYHKGTYNWFYPTPHYDGEHGGIQHAVSKDGVAFTKTTPHPFLPGGDLEIFQDEAGLFHMIKTGPEQRAKTRALRNKSLVAWVRLADIEQHGGSVLTVEHPDGLQFDGIVFAENASRRWMPGSDRHSRTPRAQGGWTEETATPDAVVQMALVFDGTQGRLYRNGVPYASYDIPKPLEFPSGSSLLIGLRHTTAAAENSLFRGRVLDARVYDSALSTRQLGELKPDAQGGPQPVAWYDFAGGTVRDRMGNFPDGVLCNGARVENGELVLEDGGYLKVPGRLFTQMRLTSPDLETWTEQPGVYIAADKHLAICPNVFKFGDWHYYICGSGVWKSRTWFGPWIENIPLRLDNLAVPKTGAFGKERRIYAGFLTDDGWGGNEVLRELVQDAQGNLGTRFVKELIPACGDPLPVRESVRVVAGKERNAVELPGIPQDYRLELEIVPEPGAAAFGLSLRANASDACDLVVTPQQKRVRFSKAAGSSGRSGNGPAIEAVGRLDRPFKVDLIVRHDILDAEIAGSRTLTTRFWNPGGDRIRLFADSGAVTFRNIRIRPLVDRYEPYPGWRKTQAARDPLALHYHLMHPGGDSAPGDPNAAFYLDGTYHLHYILQHPWQGKRSFSFVHVTSPDMLHWNWQTTKLQPAFTGHGMFSGTGFITKDGMPAAIYHGQASGRNQIAIAKDRRLSAWEKPYPIEPKTADGQEAKMSHWDPDCFLIGDTYYAISGGVNPPLVKSKDLKNWTYVGPFMKHDLPEVAIGEDISCGNFFRLGDKWMLLCISHPLGCRYYLGDWDAKAEQFVPQKHGRMNWRREDQTFAEPWRDFFAPESVLTPDGRRVMWAWLCTLDRAINGKTIQSLPRELSLPADGVLRIKPLRELESLRYDPVAVTNVAVGASAGAHRSGGATQQIAELQGDALELRITVARAQAAGKRFGFTLFADGKGGGLPIIVRPETGTLRVGNTEAPFAVADLPPGEDVTLRIFVDKYLVEVFANDRQAMIAAHMGYHGYTRLDAYSFGVSTTISRMETWRLLSTNQGFLEAQQNRIWEPATK